MATSAGPLTDAACTKVPSWLQAAGDMSVPFSRTLVGGKARRTDFNRQMATALFSAGGAQSPRVEDRVLQLIRKSTLVIAA